MIRQEHQNIYYNHIPYVQVTRGKTEHVKQIYKRYKINQTSSNVNYRSEIKNTLDGLYSILDTAEEKNSATG